jgi:hypothetical protein
MFTADATACNLACVTKPIAKSHWEATSCSSADRWSNRRCGTRSGGPSDERRWRRGGFPTNPGAVDGSPRGRMKPESCPTALREARRDILADTTIRLADTTIRLQQTWFHPRSTKGEQCVFIAVLELPGKSLHSGTSNSLTPKNQCHIVTCKLMSSDARDGSVVGAVFRFTSSEWTSRGGRR